MGMAFVVIGVMAIMISVIAGLSTGTFLGFFIWFIGGISIGMILLAFSQMIANQLNILDQLRTHHEFMKQFARELQKRRCEMS